MSLLFGTKAETLERLAPLVQRAQILPQARLTVGAWRDDRSATLLRLQQQGWLDQPVIVRSSALQEDSQEGSLAGLFTSVTSVLGEKAVIAAIDRVIDSYTMPQPGDQIFLQPQLSNVTVSGVAFSVDPVTGAPYVVVNDKRCPHTGEVTSGIARDDELFYWLKEGPLPVEPHLLAVVRLLDELERLLGSAALDVEFAWVDGTLYLLQVRRLLRCPVNAPSPGQTAELLGQIAERMQRRESRFPSVLGHGIAWGAMPDWNPAEMIGQRPRPLALELYRECITDRTWAEQRQRYGYRDVTGVPLMERFGGQALIDIRASFTSFVPAAVSEAVAGQLVDYYLDQLRLRPELHDKVEMELVFHCWTFDLSKRLVSAAVLSPADAAVLEQALRDLTWQMMDPETGPWASDCRRMVAFERWLADDLRDGLPATPAAIRKLLRVCREEAALAFAGLARAGFVAVCLVNSLVKIGVWADAEREHFFRAQQTVLSQMHQDRTRLPTAEFLARYGHLRPGTYDILVPRYDEAPEQYHLNTPVVVSTEGLFAPLTEAMRQSLMRLLSEQACPTDVDGFVRFLREAIQRREYGKFVYSRGISEVLRLLGKYAVGLGFSRDDCSFADQSLWDESQDDRDFTERLRLAIDQGRATDHAARGIVLPPLLLSVGELGSFRLPRCQPNFVTRGVAYGHVVELQTQSEPARGPIDLKGAIVLLPSADPGFDWIFSTGLAGFITMFGGANSHMAIRAREWNLPAAIGVGEARYRRLVQARAVRIDGLHQLLVTLP